MRIRRSKWLAYAICAGMLAACGGGGDDNGGGGGGEKTFGSPADGAQIAAAMTTLFNKVGGSSSTGGKSARIAKSVRPKVQSACPDGGTQDVNATSASDATIVFDQCKDHDDQGNNTTLDGQVTFHCSDLDAASGVCNDAALTFGQAADPLTAQIVNSGASIDLSGSFFDLDVTEADNGDNTSTVTLDGRAVVADNSTNSCGDADVTLDTVDPLLINNDTGLITDGVLDIASADGSSAHVVFNQDGSQTVTVNGVSDSFTPAELAAICQ